MRFHVFEDNGGGYHWTIIAANGESLVHSARFTSYEDAKQAARIVHAGAASASFAQLAASFAHLAADTPPIVLGAPRDTPPGRDDQDAERWLDEGGSFSSEAVT
jgi:uncharacterized protein YegP (UPF0339 family)